LWTILMFVLFNISMVAFYLYMKQMLPEEEFSAFLQYRGKNGTELWRHFITALALLHVFCLSLPLWAFFDWRRIRINRETLEITGRWLFIPWRKTVSRLQTKKASFNEWLVSFNNLKLGYENRSVWIGCTTPEEVESLRSEINHFLYTVPIMQAGSEATFLGGAESNDPEVALHCPHCGAKLSGEALDFSAGNAHCHSCNTDFPMDNAAAYRIYVKESKQPENITVEQTDDCLTMRYVPNFGKGTKYGILAAGWFCILMFAGMFVLMPVSFAFDARMNMSILKWCIFSVIFFIPLGLVLTFMCLAFYQDIKALYCDWTIYLNEDEARFELRCKKHRKTVVIPRDKIIEARINDNRSFKKIRFGHFPEFLWCRECVGGHFLLEDGPKHYLPLGTVNERERRMVTYWMLAKLNGFLAAHPRNENLSTG
ncbi:MAG: hypothetical protein FWE67_13835, partial [Planctomycetaceae bacterium]|nr:hypothetical protein [Planctomycetaceae bacterium]